MLACVRRTKTLVRASHNGRTGPQVKRGLNDPTEEDGGLNYPTAENGGLYDPSVDKWGLTNPSGGAWGLNDPSVNDCGHRGGAWSLKDLSSDEWGLNNPSGGTLGDPSVVSRGLNGDVRHDPTANKNVRNYASTDRRGHCEPNTDKSGLNHPSVNKYVRKKVSAVEFDPKSDQNADKNGQNYPSAVKCRNNACGHKGGRKLRVDLFCGANSRLHSVLILLFVIFTRISAAHSVSLGAHLVCSRMPGLTEKQRSMCRASPASIAAVGDGLKMAYNECRVQLAGARWNCSGVGEGNIFGHVMPLATKEAAFTYAITSAGVAHALSAACARGDLPGCGCRHSHSRRHTPEQYHWGGCGEVMFGIRFSRRFLDTREIEADARSEMNLHNNQVGRKMVKDLVRKDCKCHGVSGSCAVKTCWRALPSFRAVASALKEKYLKAKMVAPHHNSAHFVIRRSKPHLGEGREPRKNELVYLQLSPSYCEPDAAAGILGTHGRRCKKNSRGEDSCEFLCCGRGYNTLRRNVTTQCHCQFHWCCRVTCDTCWNVTDTQLCK